MVNKGIVDSKLRQFIPNTAIIVIFWTSRKSHDTLMLGSNCNKRFDRRTIEAFNVGTQKLSSLRNTNSIKAITKLGNIFKLL